jgi:hypothetical protein
MTPTDIPQAVAALREERDSLAKKLVRHDDYGGAMYDAGQMDTLDQAIPLLEAQQALLREARDTLAKSNEALDVVGEQALRSNMVVTALGVSALISENKETLARLETATKEG